MRLILFLFFSLFYANSYGCEISLHNYIYKIQNNLDYKVIQKTNCNKQKSDLVLNFLQNISGKISAKIIKIQTGLNEVTITPKMTNIININEVLNDEVELGPEKTIRDIKALNNLNQITAKSPINFKVICDNCHNKLGENNIKLINDNKTYWLSARVYKKTIAWVANQKINTFDKNLSKNAFKQKVVYLDKEADLFQEINKIPFYQTTKSLNEGEILTTTHLTPIKLVQAFSKVRLSVSGSSIKLSTTAKARKSGFLDEYIEVINLKSNKKFLAKIIDYNTVEIEL